VARGQPPVSAVQARGNGRRLAMPAARGPLSERITSLLRTPAGADATVELPDATAPGGTDAFFDEDLQLSLYVLNELHYSSIDGVDERWEWDPSLAPLRMQLEQRFEAALDGLLDERRQEDTGSVGEALRRLVEEDDGPSLSRFAERQATREQMHEHVIHRSAYQLKEADPHSFAIPRLSGGPKAALVEIQFDEYGEGRAERMHAELFAATMRALGLDAAYGAHLDRLPAITLATVNLMTLFGIHRRWRGALAGHLAAFEMTSSIPNRRYGNALRRLGYGSQATAFYDEHVTADAVHESIAAWDLADGLARDEPAIAATIVFGARALLALERLWAGHVLSCWRSGESSLLPAAEPAHRCATVPLCSSSGSV
jgi:hypothetical protein